MRTRTPLVTVLLVASLATAVPALAQFPRVAPKAKDYTVDFSFDTWKPTPGLILGTGGSADADLSGAFGLERGSLKQYSLTIRPARTHKIRLQYTPVAFDKDATLTKVVTIDGTTYQANLPATLSFDWFMSRAGYEWDFVSNEAGYLGAVVEAKLSQIRAHVAAAGAGSIGIRTNALVPAVGVAGGGVLIPHYLSMSFEVTGMKLPARDDLQGRYVDWDVRLIGHLGKNLGVQTGYRSIDARYLVDQDRGTLTMKGPYLGAFLRF
ncbi:MAG: hypothetical protein ABL971_08720 [Vicinamibacterales bacterium]